MIKTNELGQYVATGEAIVRARFNAEHDEWEYVGGYKTCESMISIRCKSCGDIIEKSYVSIRHGRKIMPCKVCKERDAAKQKEAREEARAKMEQDRQAAKQMEYEAQHGFVHICPVCGKEFKSTQKRVVCSAACRHKRELQYASRKKDRRFGRPAKIHWRDIASRVGNMTCQLCGKPCDENDYIVDARGTVICGDNFPSVDHIVPAALGGTDTWDNVQLAHRACNSKKSAHSMVMFVTDQASMNF